jgi:hypothetical protein
MNRNVRTRLRKLEEQIQLDVWLTLTYLDGTTSKLLGNISHFCRLLDMLDDPGLFKKTRAWGAAQMAEQGLQDLRRCSNIEGSSAQLFLLVRALALGPVEDSETDERNQRLQ